MTCEGTPKCCKAICAVSWVVLLVVVTLGSLVFFRDCGIIKSTGLTYKERTAFHFTIGYFLFVAFSAYVFIVLAKTDSACSCCGLARIIWAIVHLAGGIVAFVLLYRFKSPEGVVNGNITIEFKQNFILRRYRMANPRKFPDWFIEFHNTQQCCGLFSTYADPSLLERCDPAFEADPNLSRGCGYVLYDLYINCTTRIFWYVVVTLILGLLPFVIYALNYRKIAQIRKKAVAPSVHPIGPENKEEPEYDRQPGPESPTNWPSNNNSYTSKNKEDTKLDLDSHGKPEPRNGNQNNNFQTQQLPNNSTIPAQNQPPRNTNVQTQQNDLRSAESVSAKNYKNQQNSFQNSSN